MTQSKLDELIEELLIIKTITPGEPDNIMEERADAFNKGKLKMAQQFFETVDEYNVSTDRRYAHISVIMPMEAWEKLRSALFKNDSPRE